MFIIRITIALALITSFVLLAAYLVTRNKRYLTYIKKLAYYIMWFIVVAVLLFIISRVIRI